MKTVSATLARAMHEALVMRNLARLAELPAWDGPAVTSWTAAEISVFLEAASGDPLYPAFALLLLYGLRRGEVLGVRWRDVDREDSELRIRQQVQCVHGHARISPVKGSPGRRDLPLLPLAAETLEARRTAQASDRLEIGHAWHDNGLIFTTRTGRPVDPCQLTRSLRRICDAQGLHVIKRRHLRHITATLLTTMKVPPRDLQLILRYSC